MSLPASRTRTGDDPCTIHDEYLLVPIAHPVLFGTTQNRDVAQMDRALPVSK
jgi:hypothetical protein